MSKMKFTEWNQFKVVFCILSFIVYSRIHNNWVQGPQYEILQLFILCGRDYTKSPQLSLSFHYSTVVLYHYRYYFCLKNPQVHYIYYYSIAHNRLLLRNLFVNLFITQYMISEYLNFFKILYNSLFLFGTRHTH